MCVSCALTGKQQIDGVPRSARPDMGLSRRQRITQSIAFKEAYDSGLKHAGKYLVMCLRSGDDAELRLGVVASKRVFRRSVDRSKARRLLREAYRQNRFRFHGKYDVVLIARRAILDAKLGAVADDLLAMAVKAGIMEEQIAGEGCF